MEAEKFGELDTEWILLIKEALELGIEKEEIRNFLAKESTHQVVLEK